MRYLEEKRIGFNAAGVIVPLVCASSLFDLLTADSKFVPIPKWDIQPALLPSQATIQTAITELERAALSGNFAE